MAHKKKVQYLGKINIFGGITLNKFFFPVVPNANLEGRQISHGVEIFTGTCQRHITNSLNALVLLVHKHIHCFV